MVWSRAFGLTMPRGAISSGEKDDGASTRYVKTFVPMLDVHNHAPSQIHVAATKRGDGHGSSPGDGTISVTCLFEMTGLCRSTVCLFPFQTVPSKTQLRLHVCLFGKVRVLCPISDAGL